MSLDCGHAPASSPPYAALRGVRGKWAKLCIPCAVIFDAHNHGRGYCIECHGDEPAMLAAGISDSKPVALPATHPTWNGKKRTSRHRYTCGACGGNGHKRTKCPVNAEARRLVGDGAGL